MLHLLHPALVHFPIVFLVAGGLVEAFGIFARREGAERLGATLVLLGALFLIATIATGYLASNTVTPAPGAAGPLDDHERSALVLLGVVLVLTLWKAWGGGTVPPAQQIPYAIALLIGVGWTVYTALLGGRLVYGWGVGVAGP